MKRIVIHICISIISIIALSIQVKGQQAHRQLAVSVYIYNFAKNIQWQNEESIKEFNFIIIGQDEKTIQELLTLSKTKTLRNKRIKVTQAGSLKNTDNIQLIYIPKTNEKNLVKIFDQVEGKNILIVSDNYADKKLIMINFVDSEEGTLKFEINKANIMNQHLEMKPDMILLGGSEVEVAELYREGQQSLRSIQKHSESLENSLKQLESIIKIRTQEVKQNKDSLSKQAEKIQEQLKTLELHYLLIKEQENELQRQEQQTKEQKKIFDIQSNKLKEQLKELQKGNETLEEQEKSIKRQKTEILSQSNVLKKQGKTIHHQRNLVYLLVIIIILVFILAITIYRSYRSKQKLSKELENRVIDRTKDLNTVNEQLEKELVERREIELALRKSEEKFLKAFKNSPDAITITSVKEGIMIDANESTSRVTGYTSKEIIGHTSQELNFWINHEERDIYVSKLNRYGRVENFETRLRMKSGEIRNALFSGEVIEFGDERYILSVIRDITERKKAEEEIQKLNQTLELRVTERTAQLSAINKELESFSYSISHDLRAPLRAIYGFSQILARRHRSSLNEEGQQYMGYIVEASIRMEQLINDLLNYSRLGRKSIELRPISLKSIVDNIHLDFKQRIEEIGARFIIIKDLPEVRGDESLLRQIFTNLIENAITYRRVEQALEITIDYEINNENYELKISDNGIGIAEEYWEKIFSIFQRLHSEDQYPGTGIGLATVRKAVSMMNGTVWVKSEPGKGSSFYIKLPKNDNMQLTNK